MIYVQLRLERGNPLQTSTYILYVLWNFAMSEQIFSIPSVSSILIESLQMITKIHSKFVYFFLDRILCWMINSA